MAELERALEARLLALGPDVDFPPTPDLRAAVRRGPEPQRASQRRWVWALAAAAVLAIAAGLVAVPQARETVAGWLGIKGVNVQRVQHPPTPSPRASGPIGQRLALGEPETLADAQRLAGFNVLVPSALGAPDEVFYRQETHAVTLVYYPRPDLPDVNGTGVGALVTEIRATVQGPLLNKVLGPGTQLTQAEVSGAPAYWISGAPHDVFYTDSSGSLEQDTLRLATNTLVWQVGPVTYRLEASIDVVSAQRIASSTR